VVAGSLKLTDDSAVTELLAVAGILPPGRNCGTADGALQSEIKERKRLEAAKVQAERLAAVGKMAAQVAHEVRNPLGSIVLNLDFIFKEIDMLVGGNGHLPDEGRTLVNDMRVEVRRIQRVVEDYLQFAQPEAATAAGGSEWDSRPKTGIPVQ
jgi:signal transduction histidine kinase